MFLPIASFAMRIVLEDFMFFKMLLFYLYILILDLISLFIKIFYFSKKLKTNNAQKEKTLVF